MELLWNLFPLNKIWLCRIAGGPSSFGNRHMTLRNSIIIRVCMGILLSISSLIKIDI